MNKIRPRLTPEEWEALKRMREAEAGGETEVFSEGSTSDLASFLENQNINDNDVSSVKFWQTHGGDTRFSVVTKTKHEIDLEGMFVTLLEDLKAHTVTPKPIPRSTYDDGNCLVFAPADIHVGKYSSDKEVGEGDKYDTAIAIDRVSSATEDLLSMASGFNVDKIIFVIGNDILHTDNTVHTTTAGTMQDVDGMWYESFLIAERLYVTVLERLLSVADVHVVFAPSNHDYMSGFMLARVLRAFYETHPQVTFDISPSHRKYLSYGNSLIGVSHGDGAKEADMPLLMAQESGKLWNECAHRHWYLGHIHHKKTTKYQVSKDYPGVTVEYLRSPSGADSWHHRKGYQHALKAIEGFIHGKEGGQIARLTHVF